MIMVWDRVNRPGDTIKRRMGRRVICDSIMQWILLVWLSCALAQRLRVQMEPLPVHGIFAAGQTVLFHVRDTAPLVVQSRLPELVIERVVWCSTTNRPFRAYDEAHPERTGCNSHGYVRDEQRVKTTGKTFVCEARPLDAALAPIVYVELHTSRGVVVSQYRVDTSTMVVPVSAPSGTLGVAGTLGEVTWGNLWKRLVRHARSSVAWYTIALTGLVAVACVALLIRLTDRARQRRRRRDGYTSQSGRRLLDEPVPGIIMTDDAYGWDAELEESDDSSVVGNHWF